MKTTFILLLSSWVLSNITALTAEDILANREKRMNQLEQILGFLEERMEKHRSKEQVLPDDRVSSLAKRIQAYEDQLAEMSRVLSDAELQELINQDEL